MTGHHDETPTPFRELAQIHCPHIATGDDLPAEVFYLTDRHALIVCPHCLNVLRDALYADLLQETVRHTGQQLLTGLVSGRTGGPA
jgi:hypothetical protein